MLFVSIICADGSCFMLLKNKQAAMEHWWIYVPGSAIYLLAKERDMIPGEFDGP